MKNVCSRGVGLSGISHVLSALFPFVAADSIKRLGVFPASFIFYLIGTILILALLVRGKLRRDTRSAFVLLREKPSFQRAVLLFVAGGVCYYKGLETSASTVEFVFLSRLDWVLQMPAAVIFLKEPWNWKGASMAILAATGGVLVGWAGTDGLGGSAWAAGYVVFSVAAYNSITPLLSGESGLTHTGALAVRTFFITFLLFLCSWYDPVQVGRIEFSLQSGGALIQAVAAGLVLVCVFWSRFAALAIIPLWLFAGFAPLQAGVAATVGLLYGGMPTAGVLAGMALVILGEAGLAAGSLRQCKSR